MLGTPVRKNDGKLSFWVINFWNLLWASFIPFFYSDDCPIEARGNAFSDDENEDSEDLRYFSYQRSILPYNFASQIYPAMVTPSDIPSWMVAVDTSLIESKSISYQ